MKIAGFTYQHNQPTLVLKSDSSLLNQRKPFFLPDWSQDVRMRPCLVIRISHLGRHIAEKYAYRYIDAIAMGLNFWTEDCWTEGKVTESIAFDDSLCVGEWLPADTHLPADWQPILPLECVVSEVSQRMTLRTGDMLFVDTVQSAVSIEREQIYMFSFQNNNTLYCKIK